MEKPLLSADRRSLLKDECQSSGVICRTSEDNLISPDVDDGLSDVATNENQCLPSLRVYKRRWIIIGIFSILCIMQNAVWNTWGPIATTAENYFHWDNGDIAILNNWGNINIIVLILPAAWLLDNKGIRVTVLVSATLLFLSTGIRCISFESPYAIWLMNAGQFLNGISVIITLIAPTMLSSIWFPLQERITALTIISLSCNIGVTLSFLVGLSITDIGSTNVTHDHHYHSLNLMNNESMINTTGADTRERDGKDIRMIMYSEFGMCILILVMTVVYFPNRPKLPPSLSASYSRPDFTSGLKDILWNKNMWLLCISTGFTFGIGGNFIGLLSITLKQLNVNQRQAQFMGLYAQLTGIFVPIIIGKIADRINKSLKIILIFFWFILSVSSILLLLIALKYIRNFIALVYALVVIINSIVSICYPLIWQLGCEVAYPVSDGSSIGLMYLFQNIIGTIFLFLFKIPNIGTLWVLYTIAGASTLGFLIFLFIKVEYHKVRVDSTASLNSEITYGSINT